MISFIFQNFAKFQNFASYELDIHNDISIYKKCYLPMPSAQEVFLSRFGVCLYSCFAFLWNESIMKFIHLQCDPDKGFHSYSWSFQHPENAFACINLKSVTWLCRMVWSHIRRKGPKQRQWSKQGETWISEHSPQMPPPNKLSIIKDWRRKGALEESRIPL